MKHVGLHNAQHVTIILHKLPDEEHMCLVVYDNKIPSHYFTALHNVVKSPDGQAAKNLADVLEHTQLEDGKYLAGLLHQERHLKKVPCNQVFATPYGYENPNKIKLDALNDILSKIENGGDSLKKLEEFEQNRGMNVNKDHKKKGIFNESIHQNEIVEPIKTLPSIPNPSISTKTTLPTVNPQVKQDVYNELRHNSVMLQNIASQLLNESKTLAAKANELFPPTPKKGPGRPKGSKKLISNRK